MEENRQRTIKSYFALLLGVIFLSVSPLFVRWADAPGPVTSFYRMFTAVTIAGIVLLVSGKADGPKRLSWQIWILPITAGVFSGFDHAFWSTSIESTSVANATLLNYIAPLWVGLVAVFILREKYAIYFWVGMALVLSGAWIISGVSLKDLSSFSVRGEGFAIFSSIFYGGYFILSQRSRKHFSVMRYLLISSSAAMITLLLIIVSTGSPIFGYSWKTYLLFLIAGIISQFGGYYCINFALGEIPAPIVSAVLVLQPVLTALMAVRFEGEPLGIGQILGGGLVLSGVFILNKSRPSESSEQKVTI